MHAESLPTVSIYSVNFCVCGADSDCQVVWEKKPTAEEEQKAKSFQLPPTFFCGLSTTDGDTDDKADFETEVRKAQQELVTDRCKRVLSDFLISCHEMGSVDVFLHFHFHELSFNHTLDYGSFNLLVLGCKKSKTN